MLELVFRLWVAVQDFVGPDIDQDLVENVQRLAPRLTRTEAETHVRAAQRASTTTIEPGLLLAVAYIESRFTTTTVSRVEDGKRVTGHWSSRLPAGEGRRFCGPLQTAAGESWTRCLAARDVDVDYALGAVELTDWLRMAHGDVASALRGYGCGMRGLKGHPCRYYAERAARWQALLESRRAPGTRPGS